jgi:hypothetical protein
MRRSDDRLQRRQRVEGVRVPRQNVSRPAAAMTGRGTSLKAHQLVGSQLKTWQVDFEHLLGCRVEGQHADQRRRVRLVRRRRSHLHREEQSSGSARRDATGVAVQELTEASGAARDGKVGFGIFQLDRAGAVLPGRNLVEHPLAQDRGV